MQQLEAEGKVPDLPECDGLYIVGYLQEIGFDNATAAELQAWSDGTGIELQSWEFSFIRRLSRDYMSQYHDKKAAAPYQPPEMLEHNVQAVADQTRAALKWLSSGS